MHSWVILTGCQVAIPSELSLEDLRSFLGSDGLEAVRVVFRTWEKKKKTMENASEDSEALEL